MKNKIIGFGIGIGLILAISATTNNRTPILRGLLQSDLDGNGYSITNAYLNYVSKTNANNTGIFVFGQEWSTNISANITLPAFTFGPLGSSGYEFMVIHVNNTDSAVHTVTPPNGTMTLPGNVAAGPAYCTNGVYTEIIVRHLATLYTNMTVGN
jgi:hypothetical protein